MSDVTENDIKKGISVYTPIMLKIYNLWVLDISNSWIWRCSKKIQLAQFDKYVTANHLDIGVGTGYYLKNCQWPMDSKISIMDLNKNCLDKVGPILGNKLKHAYLSDIFKAQPKLENTFDSVSINYLLHCLPGDMTKKSTAIKNAVSMLKPGGTFFGATILSDKNLQTNSSQKLSHFYSEKGIFSNQKDTLNSLKQVLAESLVELEISTVGCVALFKGKRPN